MDFLSQRLDMENPLGVPVGDLGFGFIVDGAERRKSAAGFIG